MGVAVPDQRCATDMGLMAINPLVIPGLRGAFGAGSTASQEIGANLEAVFDKSRRRRGAHSALGHDGNDRIHVSSLRFVRSIEGTAIAAQVPLAQVNAFPISRSTQDLLAFVVTIDARTIARSAQSAGSCITQCSAPLAGFPNLVPPVRPRAMVAGSWELRECPNGENYIAVQTAILGFLGENRPMDRRS
jgi:hypothetical protein